MSLCDLDRRDSPLVGTVIGGVLTITGQRLTDRHRESAERQVAARQVAGDDAERDREAVVAALHRQVSADAAEVRAAISTMDGAANAERADMLAALIQDVRARSDRVAALIATVRTKACAVKRIVSTNLSGYGSVQR